MIRVLLVDDQPLVRAGLGRILRPRAGLEVAGECDDGDQVEQAVTRTRPDVVVMDLRMKRALLADYFTRIVPARPAACAGGATWRHGSYFLLDRLPDRPSPKAAGELPARDKQHAVL
jgi:DNA-binding LytR/AlgR family response regulator